LPIASSDEAGRCARIEHALASRIGYSKPTTVSADAPGGRLTPMAASNGVEALCARDVPTAAIA
jgi:hypothetical protein